MKYKLIIFDFDGTLADTLPWFRQVFNQVADEFSFKRVSESEVEMLRGCEARQILSYLGVPVWKVPMIANHMRGLMAQDIQQLRLFDGVPELLEQLSEHGFQLALASSNSEANVREVMGARTAALFDYYECGVSMFGKAGKLKRILSRAGVSHRESILIGDEIRDFEAAQRLQLAFGAVSWGYNRREALEELTPRELFATVGEIGERLV